MRRYLLLLPLILAGCGGGNSVSGAVDPAALPPLSGKERALIVAAEGASHSGNTGSAIRDYQSAIATSQGHVDAHLGLAELYLRQHQDAAAREVLLRAIEWQPNHPKANYLLGKIYLNESKPKEAAEAFLRAEQTDPSNPDVLNGAGVAQDMLGLHKLAQRYYLRAQTSGRGDPAVIRTNLGLSYLLSGEPKLAVEQLKPEAKKATAPAATRHNLALAYGMLGKNAEARALVKNEMSEEDRLLALERLKKYIAQEGPAPAAPNTPGGPKGAGAR